MKTIDEARLETDLAYRFSYLAEFVGFGPEDVARVQGCAPYLGPMIPELVDATYAKLLAYSATARHFVPRQHGYEGALPSDINALSATHPQVQFRKEHLARYFQQVLGRAYDAKMAAYFDMVGKIHTPRAGNVEIDVPLVQMNALMGLLADVLFDAIARVVPDPAEVVPTIRAFSKLLWLQNDFIGRHYGAAPAAP